MADIVTQHNIGAYGCLRALSAHTAATAGGAGAGTQVVGIAFDREGFGAAGLPETAEVGLVYTATLGAADTLSLAYTVRTSPDGATWTTLATAAAAVVATGPAGGGTVNGSLNVPVDLTLGGRYVQVEYTPTFSAVSVDTSEVVAVGFFAGFQVLPAPL